MTVFSSFVSRLSLLCSALLCCAHCPLCPPPPPPPFLSPLPSIPPPPPPTDTPLTPPDWSDVGFRVREVNGHVESHYSVHTGVWSAPEFVVSPFLSIHGLAPGLNYGQQCYEGLKTFRSPDDRSIHMFRPALNAQRMKHSASFVAMPAPPEDLFTRAVNMAVALNAEFVPPHASGASMYVRPLLFGSCAQLGLSPPDEYTFAVCPPPSSLSLPYLHPH